MKKYHFGFMVFLGLLSFSQAAEEGSSSRKRGRSPVITSTSINDRDQDFSPLYKGTYVEVNYDGKVQINQKLHPNFRGSQKEDNQFFSCVDEISYVNGKYYRQVGEPFTQEEMIGWKLEEVSPSDLPFVPQPVEAQLTDAPYDLVPEEECKTSPYFSCGRLHMTFPSSVPEGEEQKFSGSAAAIETNILVTAAHNFIPQNLNGAPNHEKLKADSARFLHIKTRGKERIACQISTAHCFIHPKWEESFDAHYDIAFVFLNQSLTETQEEKDRLLSLHVLSPELEHSIEVVGYPRGVNDMRRTGGSVKDRRDDRPVDAINIIYHTANTEPGSSGSPIVKEGRSLVGVHTRAPSPGGTMNRGVRIRLDLMSFLDKAIEENQKHLADAKLYEAEKAALKSKEERQRIEEIEAKGANEEKVRVAKALMDLLDDKTIAEKTNLPLDVVKELRGSLHSS